MRVLHEQHGFAMVAVLLVLMALFVLCAPFLLTARNADQASAQMVDRASSRLALDAAMRHARGSLGDSHVSLDRTPYFDSIEELTVTNEFPADFLDANDANGVMWDLEVEDMAGRVDLNSASPHVLANLAGGAARLTVRMLSEDTELSVNSTAGFLDAGFVFVGSELIGYSERKPATLSALVRGLLSELDEENRPLACRPQPASGHDLGRFVIDQRMFAIPEWRMKFGDETSGELAEFDTIEQVAESVVFAMVETLGEDFVALLERTATVNGGIGAGPRWQHGARVIEAVRGLPANGCVLSVRDGRYFNAGTTVMVTDGRNTEFGLVAGAGKQGMRLTHELRYPFEPYETVVYALARRPVNINTAKPEVLRALVLNLKLRAKSARITSKEADELVKVMVVSRPFTGLEDFVRRVVLPGAGLEALPADAPVEPEIFASLAEFGDLREDGTRSLVGFMDRDDAVALYKNALNANDADLEFSTMPFAFTSRNVYRMDLRASINAPSGVERTRRSREQIDMIVPQRDLLRVWARQEDFDEEPRFDRDAPGWLSGPEATGRFDRVYQSPWPSRARAHLGKYESREVIDPPPPDDDEDGVADAVLVFPSREDTAWVQLAPSREPDAGGARRVIHFDDETRDIEGRYLPDGTLTYGTADAMVRWAPAGGFLNPLSFRAWIKPRDLQVDSHFLDVGSERFPDTDSVSLFLDDGDLVLRVLDAAGDHPGSPFEEFAEVRYPLAQGPGMPLDVWTHVEVAVAGTRPDQMRMLVDGRASARTPGLTRLTASLSSNAKRIQVESTEGFPDRCVLRIGDELIEVTRDGQTSFRAQYESTGGNAGFGGRIARERFDYDDDEGFNLGLRKDTQHAVGAAVQLYGYSLPLQTNAVGGGAGLSDGIGPFGVAELVGFNGGTGGSIVILHPSDPTSSATLGVGIGGDDTINTIELGELDVGRTLDEVMEAFSPSGGYAAILGRRHRFRVSDPAAGLPERTVVTDSNGHRIGGVEVISYTRADRGSGVLHGVRRGGAGLANVSNDGDGDESVAGRASFVLEWSELNNRLNHPIPNINFDISEWVMVIPISVPVTGAEALAPASAPDARFAQITRLGGESGLTEWVRYNTTTSGHLVRDDPVALRAANVAAHAGISKEDHEDDPVTTAGPGPPVQRATALPSGRAIEPESPTPTSASLNPSATRSPPGPASSQGGGSYWHYGLGEPEVEVEEYPITRAVASAFQFRGVLGTYSHAHAANTPVNPVFTTVDVDETAGFPGRFDNVAFVEETDAYLVEYGIVQHAHRPLDYVRYSYVADGPGTVDVGEAVDAAQTRFDTTAIWVALQAQLSVPHFATARNNTTPTYDTRRVTRMSLFPSGELPREIDQVFIGGKVGSASGPGRGSTFVPSAVVDEIVFGNDRRRSQLVVGEELDAAGETLEVREVTRTTAGDLHSTTPLSGFPRDAGLLRMGDEILCYDYYDDGNVTHVVHFPPTGRGLLGTDPQPHMAGESIHLLESWIVSTLAGSLSADAAEIPIASRDEFPPAGTILIDDELIHYTGFVGGLLNMPRASEVPGAMDGKGAGLFRGRFGTEPAAHIAGTPVILFPFRYWDRWAERADAPEMHYFEFDVDQPDAFWKRVFWDSDSPPVPGAKLGVLQRTDRRVPWDAKPEEEKGLDLLWAGRFDQNGNSIGRQSGLASWRVFVRYEPGAYDPINGLAHGWKTTPKLSIFGIEFMGPNRVLRRVER